MKSIIFVTQYFPPEIGGGSQRSIGFVEELLKLGVDVTVVAPFPSYLMEKNQIEKQFRLFQYKEENGIKIFRCFVYASDRGSFLKRMLYYLSFTFSASFVTLFKLKKFDYLLTISPPLFTGIVGVINKIFRRTKFIFDIGDLWPESAIQLGFLKNKTAIQIAEWLEKLIYKKSDVVNVVTKITQEKFKSKFSFVKNVFYVPNFVDSNKMKKYEKDLTLQKELSLEGKMVFGYAGNIGGAQGIKIITDAAKITFENSNIVYMIIGDGVDKDLIKKEIEVNKLSNVLLIPPFSRDEIIKYISLFDVMIIPLIKNELFRMTIPSKLYEAMSAEIPVLLSVDGEARKIVETSDCGYFVEPENSIMLAEKIKYCFSNQAEIISKGENGRKYSLQNFDREKVVNDFYNKLNSNE